MEVRDGKEVLGSVLDPLVFSQGLTLWTVAVPAGVIGYLPMAAPVALIHMAAKGSGSAYLNGMHGPHLTARQIMGFPIVRAVLTEYIGHLDTARCTHHVLLQDYEA